LFAGVPTSQLNFEHLPAIRRVTISSPAVMRSLAKLNVGNADFLLGPTPTANDIAVIEALARKEQEAIKRRIRRTAEQVKRQSKSKQ
jgi:hypothetical protein